MDRSWVLIESNPFSFNLFSKKFLNFFTYINFCGLEKRLQIVKMSGIANVPFESLVIKPPSHPTYDLRAVIKLALAEDVAGQGLIPF